MGNYLFQAIDRVSSFMFKKQSSLNKLLKHWCFDFQPVTSHSWDCCTSFSVYKKSIYFKNRVMIIGILFGIIVYVEARPQEMTNTDKAVHAVCV